MMKPYDKVEMGQNWSADPLLIERIYECAVVPELCPSTLADLASFSGAYGGTIFTANRVRGIMRWTTSANLHDNMTAYVTGGWYLGDRRRERVVAAKHAGFLTEEIFLTPAEFETDETIQDFYRPHGLGRTAITAVMLPTGDGIALSVEKAFSSGPVDPNAIEQLDTIRPHLARSVLLSARLQLEQARAISEVLESIGLAALVFDGRGAVLAANALIQSSNIVRWGARDHVSFRDTKADAQLQRTVSALYQDGVIAAGTIVVRNENFEASAIAHLIPIRRSARDILTRGACILMVTPVISPSAPPIELVQSLFDLTPAESRVARSLAIGDTVEKIAANGGVSINTVRTQVRGVLEKTGSRRQADVIALLTGLRASPQI